MKKNFLTKKKLLIGAVVLVVVIVLGVLFSGTNTADNIVSSITMGNEDLIKVDGNVLTAPEARVFLMAETHDFSQTYGNELWSVAVDDTTVGEEVIDGLKDDLLTLMEVVAIGQDKGITLSSTEESTIVEASDYYYSQMTDSEMNYFAGRKSDIESAFTYYVLAMKTIQTLASTADTTVSDDEARVMSVQQVVTTDEGAAQSVVDKFNGGGWEFTDLASNYSTSSEVSLTISRQTVDETYAQYAYALSEGQISEPFEDNGQWYVLYCVSSYLASDTETNRASIIETRKQDAFMDTYDSELSGLRAYINEPAWELLEFYGSDLTTSVPFFDVYENYFSN